MDNATYLQWPPPQDGDYSGPKNINTTTIKYKILRKTWLQESHMSDLLTEGLTEWLKTAQDIEANLSKQLSQRNRGSVNFTEQSSGNKKSQIQRQS